MLMRRTVAALAFALSFLATAAFAGNSLSGLVSGGTISGTDLFYDVQTGGSGGVKVTANQILAFINSQFSGDCTASPFGILTCKKTNGTNFGTFATQNAPTGSTQCLQANASGTVSGTGAACGGGGGSGTVTSVAAGCGTTTFGAAITTSGTLAAIEGVNPQTGATYAIANSDCGFLTDFNRSTAIAVSIAQAGASGNFVAGWYNDVCDLGAGTATITPTTSTINGNATLALSTGTCARIVSDGTNYQVVTYGGGGGGTPGGANTDVQFNNSSAFGGDSGFTYAGSGQVTHALGTITSNEKALNITGTWNASGVTFDAPLFMNIVNTASVATSVSGVGSLLADLQVGGTTNWGVTREGIQIGGGNNGGGFAVVGAASYAGQFNNSWAGMSANAYVAIGNSGASVQGVILRDDAAVGWASSTNVNSDDTSISRAAAGVAQFGLASTGSAGWINWGGEARVTSDVPNSTTALATATGLSVALQAGRTYGFTVELSWTDAAAGGIQAAMVASGGLTATNIIYDGWIIDSGANGIKGNAQATALSGVVASATTTGTAGHLTIEGTITVNAAGTLNVQFAQNTSNATATTVKRGSRMIVQDMP